MVKHCLKQLCLMLIMVGGVDNIYPQSIKFDWVKTFGASSWDGVYGMELDAVGNIYVTGVYSNTVDFDPGVGIFNMTSNGMRDIFVAKYTNNGSLIWASSVGGNNDQYVRGLDIDVLGNVYITGRFLDTADFDPGPGVFNMISSGQDDAFVLKLDANGNFAWAASLNSSGSNYGRSICTDGFGNVYATGWYNGTIDFDPSVGIYNLSSSGADAYVWKLDTAGNFVWARSMGGNLGEIGRSINTDAAGNVLLIGSFQGTGDFDPGIGTAFLTSVGGNDIFIQKLNPNGELIWVRSIGSSLGDAGNSILADAAGNVYFTGSVRGSADFDPGVSVFNLSGSGLNDVFVEKLDTAGIFVWARLMGGQGDDMGNDLTLDTGGALYVTGIFEDSVDFDPTSSVFYLSTASSFSGLFLQKLDVGGNFHWAKSIGDGGLARGYGISNDIGGNVYLSGEFLNSVDFDPGLDTHVVTSQGNIDFFIEKLVPCSPNYGSDVVVACTSFTWLNGVTYKSNNDSAIYYVHGGNAFGCDSIVTLNLTILNNVEYTDVQSVCDSFVWVDGKTYFSNNNTAQYIISGGAANGCDSVMNLDLSIKKVNTGLVIMDPTISASASGALYKWLDCDKGYLPLPGKNSQIFTATVNGNYAVEVTENGCTDTSNCVAITTIGVSENDGFSGWDIYPNPVKTEFFIKPNAIFDQLLVEVRELNGKLLQSRQYSHQENIRVSFHFPAGVYLITLKTEAAEVVKKLVRK